LIVEEINDTVNRRIEELSEHIKEKYDKEVDGI